jgi:outer membrane protein assembly factor BamE (lipoprotein component of BamABCDE complex)
LRPPIRPTICRLAGLAALLCALPACSILESPAQSRGAHFDSEQMKQLVPGTTQRADVTSLFGSPTTHATFDEDTWIYIGQVTRPRIGRVQGVESQDVVALTFDRNGVLRKVRHLSDDDSKPVDVVQRSTASPGSSASFLQQLIGNVGRYSPGGALGGSGSSVGNTGGGLNMR